MFGLNPIRERTTDPFNLAIEGTFYTIQGEGPLSGTPALFIRLAGCNLACAFCDTQFERQVNNPQRLADYMDQVVNNFSVQQRKVVVLTGGEPLRQPLVQLVERLLETGTELIQIETAGTLWQMELEMFIRSGQLVLVCSPKTPKIAMGIMEHCHHWKYVLQAGRISDVDGLPNRGTQTRNLNQVQDLARPPGYLCVDGRVTQYCRPGDTIWVSPCDEHDDSSVHALAGGGNLKVVADVAMKHGYRVSLQMHKYLDVE